AMALAMTPAERGAIEASVQRIQTDFRDWASSHIERSEPKDDVVAQYTLPNYPAARMNFSNFVAGVFETVGKERAELIMPSVYNLMIPTYGEPTTMVV